MKLISIKIFPVGKSGWESDLLEFGKNITQLYGPNGCGKTPIVQSIAYCLGYPCQFRKDIYDHCGYAVLKVQNHKGSFEIKRVYSRDVDITITDVQGNDERFFDEKEFTKYFFEILDIKSQNLVGTNNQITTAYLSTFLPLFYIDQDEGYSKIYSSPVNFIRDQFSEMIRILFGLPVKNSFDAKKSKLQAKDNLDFWDKRVQTHARIVETAIENTANISKTSEELTLEIQQLEAELERLKTSGAGQQEALNVFDRSISEHMTILRSLDVQIAEVHKRRNGVNQIIEEINTEIDTLNLNEEARRLLTSFSEICGDKNCKLFSSSSDAYSKNLLYLKDQIKDLERNSNVDLDRLSEFANSKVETESTIKSIVQRRNLAVQKSDISALVDAISEIKNNIFDLQGMKNDVEKVENLRKQNFEIINNRNKAYSIYQSFSSDKSFIPELARLKADLRQAFIAWLDQLHTRNISKDITFKDDFVPLLGDESISHLKGSTRIRAVLAYHAALLELISKDKSKFQFLIFDTPKQHEIHNDDLDRYFKALKALCIKFDVQVVFSTTEYHYTSDELDSEWNPQYPGSEQNMFLEVQGGKGTLLRTLSLCDLVNKR